MDKRFLGILAGILIAFAVIFAISQGGDKSNNSGGSSNAQPTNHIKGDGQKKVTLMEYGDFQCPVCKLYEPTVEEVYSRFSKDIFFQFRNLPLVSVHPNAFAGARAAEAADKQGKYWQMHDKLYANQSQWSSSNNPLTLFKSYAAALSMDVNKFSQDYASSGVNDAINADLKAFEKTGQSQATPTFFLDGKAIDNHDLADPNTGFPSADKFSDIINAEIAKQNKQ